MNIGVDDGCHEVPDPIAPIEIKFVSLEPTRIAMSSPDITSNGDISAGMSMPAWLGSVFSGVASGAGEAAGCGSDAGCSAGVGAAAGAVVGGIW